MGNRYILTGGIASGKSTVISKLKNAGVGIIDADKISHAMFWENLTEIQKMFNTELVGPELRKYIGSIVFQDTSKMAELEGLLHPLVWAEADRQAKLFGDKPFIYDNPLYFERATKHENDFVILVHVNRDTQLDRLKKRNDLTHEEATDRINSQMSPDEKLQKADYIIDNNGGLEDLDPYIEELVKNEF